MPNINNTVNYEINVKQKYSWSTVFAWLYLKTIGRILPKKWNKWAENILYCDKTTESNEIRTDDLKTTDESAQIDLKPEVAEKGSQSEIISKDGEVQTEENSEFTDESCFDAIVNDEFIDEDYDSMEKVSIEEDEELNKQLEDVSQELELERSQNVLLEEENRELRSKLVELEKNYRELAEDAGKREEELVGVEEKDAKINSLMRLNEGLDEDKKKMEAEVENLKRQLQSIQESKQQLGKEKIDLEGKLKDLSSQLSTAEVEKKSSENEVARLQEQVRILEGNKERELAGIDDSLKKVFLDMIGMLEKELLINNQEQQLQGKKVDLIERLKAELKKESDEALQETREKLAEQEKLIEQLKKEQKQAEDQSKADIKKLQEEKRGQLAEIDSLKKKLESSQSVALSSIQAHSETLGENYELKIQQVKNSTAEDEQQNGKLTEKDIQEQTKTKASDAVSLVSTVSTVKSTTGSSKSTLSKSRNLPSKLFWDKNLNNFLSRKNEELKKGFPEFKEKHFCHNVRDETIKFLSNQDDGKFESSKLLELLESNLKQSAREIIEAKVKEVVNEYCNIGKNVGKELRDGTLKAKLSPSVRKCVKKLEFNKQEEGVNKIVDSILHRFNSKNNNNDSGELLKEIATEKLTEAKMKCFASKIQELQLPESIRDKFLSPDQGMCNQTQGGVNEYQLTEKAKKEYTPNSSMNHTNTVSVHLLNAQRVA